MVSGKFLERMKLYKPGTSGTKLKYYVQSDFYINATVVAQVHSPPPIIPNVYSRSYTSASKRTRPNTDASRTRTRA